MISIIIPTYNNLLYLRKCIESINKNSFYKNEILVHINEGNDGTIEYIEDLNIKFTHSKTNIGLCSGCNIISRKSKFDLILYSHDDMYYLPNWDKILIDKVTAENIGYLNDDGKINYIGNGEEVHEKNKNNI